MEVSTLYGSRDSCMSVHIMKAGHFLRFLLLELFINYSRIASQAFQSAHHKLEKISTSQTLRRKTEANSRETTRIFSQHFSNKFYQPHPDRIFSYLLPFQHFLISRSSSYSCVWGWNFLNYKSPKLKHFLPSNHSNHITV